MIRKLLVEFIGTFFIIFFGFISIINNFYNQTFGSLFISLSFAISTIVMFVLFHKISKANFNPAISFSFFITGVLSLKEFLFYSLSQILGGFFAMIILALIFSKNISLTLLTTNSNIINNSDLGQILIIIMIEFIASFILMFVYKTDKKKNYIVIGFTIFILNLIFYGIDGMGLNPVRVLIPSLFSLNFTNVIFYLTGIFAGMVSGSLFHHWLFKKKK
ncbi:MAG TPA: aquaporin [Spirochaetota bacterium]|nr:aquaporin [Spirochaetota bacterium]